jgi:hypothetical protein
MGKQARQEYLAAIRKRYHLAGKKGRRAILDEFCKEKSRQLHSLASVSQKRHAHVEEKNWTIVRQYIGYQRLEKPHLAH